MSEKENTKNIFMTGLMSNKRIIYYSIEELSSAIQKIKVLENEIKILKTSALQQKKNELNELAKKYRIDLNTYTTLVGKEGDY